MDVTRFKSEAENSLAERIREGHESAFEEFRVKYTPRFYYYFRHRGLPEADAVELTADCITDISLKVRDHFSPTHTCFAAWVNLLRQRAATDWWRRKERLNTVELDENLPSPVEVEPDGDAEVLSAIGEAISKLHPLDRGLVSLRYGAQIQPSFAEIATELSLRDGKEIKEATIRQRHARALNKLKGLLCLDSRLANVLKRINWESDSPSE
jgi:RNA polymerase sigma factor (sigma-70 family)